MKRLEFFYSVHGKCAYRGQSSGSTTLSLGIGRLFEAFARSIDPVIDRGAAVDASAPGGQEMDTAYVSAFAALAGSVIGGLTSLGASWISQNVQARTQWLLGEKGRRQELYRGFIEEASKIYGDALTSDQAEIAKIIGLYAMVSRMRILSSRAVVESAEAVIEIIADTYQSPNKTLADLRGALHSQTLDPLCRFSEACRGDLAR